MQSQKLQTVAVRPQGHGAGEYLRHDHSPAHFRGSELGLASVRRSGVEQDGGGIRRLYTGLYPGGGGGPFVRQGAADTAVVISAAVAFAVRRFLRQGAACAAAGIDMPPFLQTKIVRPIKRLGNFA